MFLGQPFASLHDVKHASEDIKISVVKLAHKLFNALVDVCTSSLDVLVCLEFFFRNLLDRDLRQLRQSMVDDAEARSFLVNAFLQDEIFLVKLLLKFRFELVGVLQACLIQIRRRLQFLQ